MKKISDLLERISRILIGILMIVLSGNVLLQVLFRQVFRVPMTWTDEVARFSFIWLAMIAASVQVRHHAHFAVTAFTEGIKQKQWLNLFTYLFMLFVSGMLFFYGIRYTIMGLDKMAATLPITMVWIYAAIPTGSLFMMIYLLELIGKEIKKKVSREE